MLTANTSTAASTKVSIMASVGRPTDYTQEIGETARAYLSDDESVNYKSYSHAIPSVVGLCRVLNRARSTVYQWAENEDHEFADILATSKEFQELVTLNGTLAGTLNPQIGKLVLGLHGYHDKQQTELSGPEGKPIETMFNFIEVSKDK